MRKLLFLLVLGTGLTGRAMAQTQPTVETIKEGEQEKEEEPTKEKPVFFEQPKPEWKQKMHYGGNIWLGFFGAFYVDASPMVGYEITSKGTIAGLGASFIYQGQFNQGGGIIAGPRLFIRQPVWRSIFAHAEYEMMNAPVYNFYDYVVPPAGTPGITGRKWGGSPLIGVGFYQGGGGQQRGSFLALMYNLGYPNFGFISPQGLGGNNSPLLLRFGFFF